ncbi:hypothetical protein PT974_11555 [Cladobotryum mycophilum]|uniref:Stress-response A/B barrel domain-containing protein n=1 Tax=Cladobotryum mycophilum TaxID=491253 RepID=A0ABR0S5I6_9HYPO
MSRSGYQKPYIVSLKGGKDHSIEGKQHGHSHAFVVEFSNIPDRNYYVDEDPAHDAFKQKIGPLIEKVTVLDYTHGNFEPKK